MNLIQHNQFSRLIRIDKRLREVNFLQRSAEIYDTDMSDERGNRYSFQMIKEGEQWKIKGDKLPAWITANESAIHESLLNTTNG